MTQTEYVAHSGLTKGRVSQLVKAGMPLTSPEAADAWRGSSAQKRAAGKRDIQRTQIAGKSGGPYRPPEADVPVDDSAITEATPRGAYERLKRMELNAYNVAEDGVTARAPDAPKLIGNHAQAARNLVAARQEVLDLEERERRLVSGDWVRKAMTEHDGAVATLLRAMPKQLAGRIAPHDPEHAEQELDRWVQEVALATLHNTDPWKA